MMLKNKKEGGTLKFFGLYFMQKGNQSFTEAIIVLFLKLLIFLELLRKDSETSPTR